MPPNAVQIALSRPICGWPAGCHAYTKRQMTDAPTSEIASGRKTNGLGQRLAPDAIEQPGEEEPEQHAGPVPTISQMTLFRRIVEELGLGHDREVVERELAGVVGEAR